MELTIMKPQKIFNGCHERQEKHSYKVMESGTGKADD